MVGDVRDDEPLSSGRPGDPGPPLRVPTRRPPDLYYRRLALATVLPGAGPAAHPLEDARLGPARSIALGLGGYLLVAGLCRRGSCARPRPRPCSRRCSRPSGSASWSARCCGSARSSSPRSSTGRGCGAAGALALAAAVVACTLVGAPAALAVRYLEVQSSVIDEVFSAPAGPPAGAALADVEAADPWADVPRVNTLLIGSDAGRTSGAPAPTRSWSSARNTADRRYAPRRHPAQPRARAVPRGQPVARPLPQRLQLRRRVPHERHLDPRRGSARPVPRRREPRPPGDGRRRRRDHRPGHRPLGRHQPARFGPWSTPWAASTSTCSSASASSATQGLQRRHRVHG